MLTIEDLENLYEELKRDLFRSVAGIIGYEPDDVNDVIQNAFVKLIKKIQEDGGIPSDRPRGYIFVTVQNEALSFVRQKGAEHRALQKLVSNRVVSSRQVHLENAKLLADILADVESLPGATLECRTFFRARFVHGMKSVDIARKYRKSVATVNRRIKYVLDQLRRKYA